MSDTKLSLAVLQRISEFLADLPEEHLVDIADGKAQLTFIPVGGSEPRRPAAKPARSSRPRAVAAPAVDMTEAREALSRMASRDEGRVYLKPWRADPELRDLAASIGLSRSGRKDEVIDRIVERTIGGRVNSDAVRGL